MRSLTWWLVAAAFLIHETGLAQETGSGRIPEVVGMIDEYGYENEDELLSERLASEPDDVDIYKDEEALLREKITSDPGNAENHFLLGELLMKSGRPEEALVEFEEAKRIGGENAELMKKMGTAQKWIRQYRAAKKSYLKALELNPEDEEAKEDLENLDRRRGITLRGWLGGWEPDYTTESYEGMVSYGGLDSFDLNAGFGHSDQVYYTRDKIYAGAYYFYNPGDYLKLYLSRKDYNYPADSTGHPNPDTTAYDEVPAAEFEISHWMTKYLRGTISYEIFKPNFFYDKDSTADNSKATAELYYVLPLDSLRFKLIYAVLRDPDSDETTIKGRNGATDTHVSYKSTSLIGGSVEVSRGRYDTEIKYLPNRDLDDSYDHSVLVYFKYNFTDSLAGKLDYVYDSYSDDSYLSGKEAHVYMISGYYKLNQAIEVGAGYKYIDLPNEQDSAVFASLAFKTGVGF